MTLPAFDSLAATLGLPSIEAILRTGRTVRYSIALVDGRRSRIGTIAELLSEHRMRQKAAVAFDVLAPKPPPRVRWCALSDALPVVIDLDRQGDSPGAAPKPGSAA